MKKYIIALVVVIGLVAWGQVWATNNPDKALESLESATGKVLK